jgi:PAS domain S-box-containing protein
MNINKNLSSRLDQFVIPRLRFVPLVSTLCVWLIAVGVIVLHLLRLSPIPSYLRDLSAMKVMTAIGLIIVGGMLWVAYLSLSGRIGTRTGKVIALSGGTLIILASGSIIALRIFGGSAVSDAIRLIDNELLAPSSPGASICLLSLGIALFFTALRSTAAVWLSQSFAMLTLTIPLIRYIGLVYSVHAIAQITNAPPMAPITAFASFIAGAGVLALRPDTGFMAGLTSDTAGGKTLRRLLPFTVLVPFVLGWLRLEALRTGLAGLGFGLTILVVCTILILTGIVWWNSLAIDRSERERARVQDNLRGAEERYRTTLDHMLEGCQIIGFDWRYLYVNEVAATQGRQQRSTLTGKTMMECYPGIEATEMFAALRACMGNRVARRLENEFTYPDGKRAWFTLSIEPVPEGIFILSSDITNEKKLQRELEEHRNHLAELVKDRTAELEAVNKELEAFSYSVSHDLRAPLRHIDGFAELLSKHAGGHLDAKSRRFIETICNSAKEMGTLIDELLVFSRMGRAEIKKVRYNVNDMVKGVISELKGETAGRHVEWKIDDLPEVFGDPSMMRLVWVNVISNAVKYTRNKERACIEIGTIPDGSDTVFFVRDNGVGFDMEFADKLFGVFQRLHRTQDFEGIGVGLANVKRIMTRHGGKVWAEGEVDQGATFYFSLPKNRGGAT